MNKCALVLKPWADVRMLPRKAGCVCGRSSFREMPRAPCCLHSMLLRILKTQAALSGQPIPIFPPAQPSFQVLELDKRKTECDCIYSSSKFHIYSWKVIQKPSQTLLLSPPKWLRRLLLYIHLLLSPTGASWLSWCVALSTKDSRLITERAKLWRVCLLVLLNRTSQKWFRKVFSNSFLSHLVNIPSLSWRLSWETPNEIELFSKMKSQGLLSGFIVFQPLTKPGAPDKKFLGLKTKLFSDWNQNLVHKFSSPWGSDPGSATEVGWRWGNLSFAHPDSVAALTPGGFWLKQLCFELPLCLHSSLGFFCCQRPGVWDLVSSSCSAKWLNLCWVNLSGS